MRVIIDAFDDDYILAVRAAKISIDKGRPKSFHYIEFENDVSYCVNWNKKSVTVWKQNGTISKV